jgi:hypothetical protein
MPEELCCPRDVYQTGISCLPQPSHSAIPLLIMLPGGLGYTRSKLVPALPDREYMRIERGQ